MYLELAELYCATINAIFHWALNWGEKETFRIRFESFSSVTFSEEYSKPVSKNCILNLFDTGYKIYKNL